VALYGCGLLGLCGLVRCHEYYSIVSVLETQLFR
jgi:hypothetical protein